PVSVPEGASRYVNRELSFLDYVSRVLAMAEDRSQPLLERAKFLAIFSEHLDEFFQVRVAALKGQVAAGLTPTAPDGMTPVDQLREIRHRIEELVKRESAVFVGDVVPELAASGIVLSDWETLDDDDREYLVQVF